MQPQPEPAPFYPAAAVVADAFALLEVPERLSVSEAAERYRVLENRGGGVSGPWTFDLLPFLRRPMDCLGPDNSYATVAVIGPAQTGKSSIGDNWLLYSAICDPADMLMLGPDKAIMRDYSVSQIDRMVRSCPELRRRLRPVPSADNIFSKLFQGMAFFIAWPVASQLRARPVPRCRIDDYDAVPEDIDGEGNALVLMSGRQTTFEGFEKTYVNSSPALGADRGIEAVVASGTDERWTVRCLQCDHPFALDWDHVSYHATGTPEEAAESVCVVCPDCGHPHAPGDKRKLMARGAYVGAGQEMQPDGRIVGELRRTSIASFRWDGLIGLASWGRLAELARRAEQTFEATQDEDELRAFMTARVGRNFVSRLAGAKPVTSDALVARAEAGGHVPGEVPDWAICLTAAVDVQANRFEVMVMAWGPGLEAAIVDRFPILALEDGTEAMDPAGRVEHWAVLLPKVMLRRYPVAGQPHRSLAIVNTAIDTGGLEGVTDNAFSFWHTVYGSRGRAGLTSLTLVKGGSNPRGRMLPPPTVDTKRRLKGHPDPELFVPNVNRVKDMLNGRLHREEPGPLFLHLPRGMEPTHIAELTAEQKVNGLWVRKPGEANETWDLWVYNAVALMRHGASDPTLNWVPDWARPQDKPAGEPRSPEIEVKQVRAGPRRKLRTRVRGRR